MLPTDDHPVAPRHRGVLLHDLKDAQGHLSVQVLLDLLLPVDRDHSWLVHGVRAGVLLHEQLHVQAVHLGGAGAGRC